MKEVDMKKLIILFSIFFGFSNVFADLRYVEIRSIKNLPEIEIKQIEDMDAIITEYGIRIGYLQKNSAGSVLYVIGNSVYFSFAMNGYDSLNDFRRGVSLQFKNGQDFYKAQNLGLENGEIYYYYAENSFHSPEDCKDAFRNGFNSTDNENSITNVYGQRKRTASAGYYEAKELGLKTFAEYTEYLYYTRAGFNSKADYQTALAKGFKNGKDFYLATEAGFSNFDDFNSARKFGLAAVSDYQVFSKIKNECNRIMTEKKTDKKDSVIYYYIQGISKGELSLSVLSKNLSENFMAQSKELCNALNLWASDFESEEEYKNQQNNFSRWTRENKKSLIDIKYYFHTQSLAEFFKNVEISTLGSYNEKTEIFKKK